MSGIEDEAHGFDLGAVDYIIKPISSEIVLRRVHTHLSLVKVESLQDLSRESILMLGEAGHYNDTDTGQHIWRMSAYARAIAEAVNWSEEKLDNIELAAPMHDTGKIGIPNEILQAPSPLNNDEWIIMKSHTNIGYKILSKSSSKVFQMAAQIAVSHHEKWDGTGYPKGLSGEDIPEVARIVALADVFDALIMKRAYKDAWSIEDTMIEIRKNSGSHFEPRLVDALEEILPKILEIKQMF